MSNDDKENVWQCEFCNYVNVVDLVEEEVKQISQSEMVDYLVQQPDVNDAEKGKYPIAIFCIDVSGSMAVTSEVEGKISFKGSESREKMNQELRRTQGDGGHQFLPGQRQNVTYVSRLQCVQAAVAQQIEQIYAKNPNTKVGLFSFSDEVKFLGDGSGDEQGLEMIFIYLFFLFLTWFVQ